MKCLNFLLVFFFFVSQAIAQQNHFIYIQTDNKQPFYVRLGDRLLSSSSVGYIVIPKLQNGKHELNIGFPKNEWPQQQINVVVNDDAGYVLKNFETKGWGLFNMQTLDVIMSVGNSVKKEGNVDKESDGFADVLADVVNTPSIKDKPAPKELKEEKKPVEIKPTSVADNQPVEIKPALKEQAELLALKPAIRLFTTLDNTGRSMTYIDTYNNYTDTIRVYIPYKTIDPIEKPAVVTLIEPAAKVETKKQPVVETEIKGDSKEDKKFINMDLPNPNTTTDSGNTATVKEKKEEIVITKKEEVKPVSQDNATITMINSDCKSIAGEDDFLKLRKKMAAQKSDDNMIVVAKKAFVAKCYTTEQIGNLSSLFLNDEGRYNFFDASYPHVNDTRNYSSLITKLTDEYYINRFKAMLRH